MRVRAHVCVRASKHPFSPPFLPRLSTESDPIIDPEKVRRDLFTIYRTSLRLRRGNGSLDAPSARRGASANGREKYRRRDTFPAARPLVYSIAPLYRRFQLSYRRAEDARYLPRSSLRDEARSRLADSSRMIDSRFSLRLSHSCVSLPYVVSNAARFLSNERPSDGSPYPSSLSCTLSLGITTN